MTIRRIAVAPLVLCLLLVSALTAWAHWTAGSVPGGNGAAAATSVAQGQTPGASATGRTVIVTWAASTLTSGQSVDGYVVKRYDSGTLAPQTILSACTGTLTATTCTESNVPEGTWVYSVTPKIGTNWVGAESPKSSVVTVAVPPTVTINQAVGQADPTSASPVNFAVVFSEVVTGFATGEVTLGGTSGGTKVGTVTGSGTTYNVAVTGMTTSGTIVATVAAGVAVDGTGNTSTASTSTDNSVSFVDTVAPTVTINQAAAQLDPTSASTINFTVVFSEPVTGFATGDVWFTGSASGTKLGTVTGTGTTYNVAVTGMGANGTVIANVPAAAAIDPAGNANTASTSTDNTVTRDTASPTATINQAAGQLDPASGSTINFTVVFSESVTGFATGDVTFTGTAGGTKVGTVTGSGTTYNVAVTGMTTNGTVIPAVPAGVASDAAGNTNTLASRTDGTVTWDGVAPTVTINQAAGQADPTGASTINFTVTFSETVTGFVTGEVTFTGTAGGTKVGTVTGSGTTYNVAVTGMTTDGTVIATVAAGVIADAAGNANLASTSTDNSVTRDTTKPTVTINQAAGQVDPTGGSPINFTVVFSESVTGFVTGEVTFTGTAGGTKVGTVTGSGTTYNVAVTGMTTNGTVIANVAAAMGADAAGNTSFASTSTDNSVSYLDVVAPTVTINQAAGQADPATGATTINFTVVFSEVVTGFITGDVTISGTAGGTKTATVSGSGPSYNVAVTGMTGSGTVIATIAAAKANDVAGNANTASTSTDNTVTR